jgi:hypothetical protein
MTFDWGALLCRLRPYPPEYHRFLAPCPQERITAIEQEIGSLPPTLRRMVEHFNGAELFNGSGPMLTVFGLSTVPPRPPLEWAEDWHIDKFTPTWRTSGGDRNDDWALGMTNYGGLILFNEYRGVKEWDTSTRKYTLEDMSLNDWIERVLSEGETMVAELASDALKKDALRK